MSEPLLAVKDLSVSFRQAGSETLAVDRVSFEINKGETVALVGESGSGKSVTVLSIMKLLPYPAARHPSGTIHFKGQELLAMPEDKIRQVRGNDITIVFQEPMTSLNPLHTIEKQIGEILLLHRGMAGEAARRRTLELLTQVGLPDPEQRLGSYPHQLSGGQRKRVGLAQVLIRDPEILLMDEPFGPLDAQTRQIMGNLLLALWAAERKAVLFVTHDLEEAIALADRVVVMSAGPRARIIGDHPIDLGRPRDVSEVRLLPRYHELYKAIWGQLREEVLRAYGGGVA